MLVPGPRHLDFLVNSLLLLISSKHQSSALVTFCGENPPMTGFLSQCVNDAKKHFRAITPPSIFASVSLGTEIFVSPFKLQNLNKNLRSNIRPNNIVPLKNPIKFTLQVFSTLCMNFIFIVLAKNGGPFYSAVNITERASLQFSFCPRHITC